MNDNLLYMDQKREYFAREEVSQFQIELTECTFLSITTFK